MITDIKENFNFLYGLPMMLNTFDKAKGRVVSVPAVNDILQLRFQRRMPVKTSTGMSVRLFKIDFASEIFVCKTLWKRLTVVALSSML